MDWITGLNDVIRYIEDNLTGKLSSSLIAKHACFSSFYLQRMFAMMTDISLSDYIRNRRLSMAGQELQLTEISVLNVALKYGYETPESFSKAFRRFHGISPVVAKRARVQLRYQNPLHIKVTLTGEVLMDYTVEEMKELIIIGMERNFSTTHGFTDCPKFWDEYCKHGWHELIPGYVGLCIDDDTSETFAYTIGCFADTTDTVPEGFTCKVLPAGTWIKFRTHGSMPSAIQQLNRRIFTEWLPNNPSYVFSKNMNLEVYSKGDMTSDDYESEIWLPIEKK